MTIEALIVSISLSMGFDPNIALSVAKVESKLNPSAVGKIGEIGLFQLRPELFAPSCLRNKTKKSYVLVGDRSLQKLVDNIVSDATHSNSRVLRAEMKKKHLCGKELFDPKTNITIAIRYLIEAKERFSHYGELGFLTAYNSGFSWGGKIKAPARNQIC